VRAQKAFPINRDDKGCDRETLSATEVASLAILIASEIERRKEGDQSYVVCAVDEWGNEILRVDVCRTGYDRPDCIGRVTLRPSATGSPRRRSPTAFPGW
jgi:hypothetical protein